MVSVSDLVLVTVFPLTVSYAAASDLITMRIPNPVSLVLIVGFLIVAVFFGMPAWEILERFAWSILILACTFILFTRGYIGGGDAKFMPAAALWFEPHLMVHFLLVTTLLGGALTLAILGLRKWAIFFPERLESLPWLSKSHKHHDKIPYGIAIALAALGVYPVAI